MKKWLERQTFQRILTMTMVLAIGFFFLIFSMVVTDLSERKIRENVRDNMSMVLEQFDIYLGNHISAIFEGFQEFETSPSLVRLRFPARNETEFNHTASGYLAMWRLINQFLNANSTSVYSVYISFGDEKTGTQAYQNDPLKINYSYGTWKERFPDNQYYWLPTGNYRDLVPDEEVGAVLFHLYEGGENGRNGIILIALSQDFFEGTLNMRPLGQEAAVCLVSDYGIMQFGDEEALELAERERDLFSKGSGTEIRSERIDGYMFLHKQLKLTGWELVYGIRESSISNVPYIKKNAALVTAAGMVIVAIAVSLIAQAVSRPINQLSEQVEDPDVLNKEIAVCSYAEINSLSNSLEGMRRRINGLIDEVETEQDAKRQIEIALLQAQVKPHFLYNTLYSCMQLCEMKQPEKAGRMLSALSSFYRISLNGGESIVSVNEELKCVKNYLFIQHFRYSDVFDYTIDCSPEILCCRIPKMSLQPLVENAIYHGVKQKWDFGNICILGGTGDGVTAFLEVHDDGPGMTQEQIGLIRKQLEENVHGETGVSFGIKNVDARVKFEFGQEYGVGLSSVPGDTCVRITFRMEEMK